MIVTTRIPNHRNVGTKISRREMRVIPTGIRNSFGGYSLDGPFEGCWTADDGQVYQETSFRLEILVSPENLKKARQMLMDIGLQLGQRAIFSRCAKEAK